MRSPHAVLLGTQQPQILHLPADVASLAVAGECIELAEAYGPPLDEAQKITLNAWMGTRIDGTWAASLACHAVSRQNGKGDEVQARELYGLTQLGESIIHTSHELPTSVDAFLRLVNTFEAYDDLRRLVQRVRYANGEQGIDLRSGASIKYRARSGGGGRGLTDIATVVYDEAQHLKPEHMAASSSTRAVHPNPQVIMTGSAGMSFSQVWWEKRLDALRNVGGRFAYVEHTAEECSIDAAGKFSSVKPAAGDVMAWVAANPAFGRPGVGISRDFLESELRLLGEELHLREHCGVWDPLPAVIAATPPKLPPAEWAAIRTTAAPDLGPGDVMMAYDVELDGSYSAVSIASGSQASGYVETIEFRPGVGWLAERLVELFQRWDPPKLALDAGCGPAAAALSEILEAFAKAEIPADRVAPLTIAQYRAASGSFYQAVRDRKVSRPMVEHDRLGQAGGVATERQIGESWVFDRRKTSAPVVPLTSAVMARSLLGESAPAKAREPFFFVT